ncbi:MULTISPECIES: Asp23/Gls24 family envelope stress response protein [Amycolatopsis]|uniref:Asp23/Gls24 family envelope stress response protein n=1 Tax=Amycolatopsis bullii TaxID=941987 RepID=A0ABQ3K7Q6_9PSEU|nr:Asp23/Gls24 family envelope stress response protein [Amycolatopsis bullii]GHG07480.1 hypothetical protein GCM10017567_25030 [Amycolatopsis bullii]
MSDVINSIFGRPQNETAGSGGYSYGSVEPEPATEAAAVVEETDSAPEADTATETTGESTEDTAEAGADVTGTDEEAVAEDAEEDDTDETEDAAEAADDEPVAEAVDTEAADEEPIAETAPAAETVEAEPVAEAVEAEPVAEPAAPIAVTEPEADAPATRPAPGSRGSTTVADGVVGKIVTRIAAQTEGVHSVAGDGITVELADEVAWVTIPVVVEFGHAVKALGEQIRVAVIDAVEQYLGLGVEVVDVHVTDIHFPEAG